MKILFTCQGWKGGMGPWKVILPNWQLGTSLEFHSYLRQTMGFHLLPTLLPGPKWVFQAVSTQLRFSKDLGKTSLLWKVSFASVWSCGPHAYTDPKLGLMFWWYPLEILSTFWTEGPAFSCCTGPCTLCSLLCFYFSENTGKSQRSLIRILSFGHPGWQEPAFPGRSYIRQHLPFPFPFLCSPSLRKCNLHLSESKSSPLLRSR